MDDREQERNLLDELSTDAPLKRMRSRFDEMLAEPPRGPRRPAAWRLWAAAAAVVLAGLVVARGRAPLPGSPGARTQAVLEMLDAPSAFERLRAVNAAGDLPESWSTLGPALLERLEQDESVNVRLSALDVLLARDVPAPRSDGLVDALLVQKTAIVQAHLAHHARKQDLFSPAELARLSSLPGIHEEARDILFDSEES